MHDGELAKSTKFAKWQNGAKFHFKHEKNVQQTGLWSRKSRHPTPTPGNFNYPTPGRLRPLAVLVT